MEVTLEDIIKELKEIRKLLDKPKKSSRPLTGCNCGSNSGVYGAWQCPEHGSVTYDYDFGTVNKVDY